MASWLDYDLEHDRSEVGTISQNRRRGHISKVTNDSNGDDPPEATLEANS